jgi:hypothetical protein
MKKIYLLAGCLFPFTLIFAQSTPALPNGGFETWEGSGTSMEPESYNSNKTGSSLASVGPQTCFQETSSPHSGSYCVRMESKYYFLAVVNGSLSSGVINAPSSNKAEGYIGTINHSSASDIRRISFDGRPDSLVGWYKYTSAGSSAGIPEQGKVRGILHVGNYFDPEVPFGGNHPDSSMNKIADVLFLTPTTDVTSWTRFSVPFVYTDSRTPEYIMLNMTSSANQLTTVPGSSSTPGSKLWLDDLQVIYNPSSIKEKEKELAKVYCFENVLRVQLLQNVKSSLTIFDISGKKIASYTLSSDHSQFNLNGLGAGMYLYLLQSEAASTSGKFIIR